MKVHAARPIGVFDSGLGGLTVIKEMARLLPKEKLIYVGDTARVPYGTKSPQTIERYAAQIAFFLMRKRVKMIVVACNSASSVALNALKKIPIPVIGVIQPGARAAAQATHNRKVGVIGTQTTVSSGAYKRSIKKQAARVQVWEKACPLFVPMVEEGRLNDTITRQVASEYLSPLKKKKIDTLVLGCTHYPLLKPVLRTVMGRRVQLIDSAGETAKDVRSLLQKNNLINRQGAKAKPVFYTTDNPANFYRIGRRFLGRTLRAAHYLPLDSL